MGASDKPYNPWREFIENVINGDNFFRTQEYYDLLDDIDARIAKEAEQDARIAELTEEVDELRYDLGVAKDLLAELTAEVVQYKATLQYVGFGSDDYGDAVHAARNVLKEKV
jgi:uncharacterized membrane protein